MRNEIHEVMWARGETQVKGAAWAGVAQARAMWVRIREALLAKSDLLYSTVQHYTACIVLYSAV